MYIHLFLSFLNFEECIVDFRDLKYFEVIATEGSLARAAERVHRTQPALTKCIDRLEEDMGTKLFEKDGRGMRLTAAGHVLLRRTRQMALMVEETQREMRDVAGGLQGEVRIGCMATLAEHLMPAVFEQLLADAPGITVHLAVAMNDTLVNWLRDGEVDMAVGPMLDGDVELQCEQIAEDTMVVMASEHHPVFASPCTLPDLLQYQWVMPAPTVASRQWLEQTFERHGLPRPRVQIESNVLNTILPVLERTPLLGFTSRFNLLAQRARVREVAVPEMQLQRRFGLVYRRQGYLPPVAERVAQLLRERGKDFYLPNA
ncbi:LysR family transcriptional regulator [Pseudoduganella ginsengisoli]